MVANLACFLGWFVLATNAMGVEAHLFFSISMRFSLGRDHEMLNKLCGNKTILSNLSNMLSFVSFSSGIILVLTLSERARKTFYLTLWTIKFVRNFCSQGQSSLPSFDFGSRKTLITMSQRDFQHERSACRRRGIIIIFIILSSPNCFETLGVTLSEGASWKQSPWGACA